MTDIKALELAYVRIQVPDLDEAERFFTAFGLPTQVKTADRLYARGTGPDHHLIVAHRGEQRLLATAYELRSEADLERASRLPDASAIQPIDGPGGGWRVMLTDLDGNGVELVHGITKIEPIEVPKQEFKLCRCARSAPQRGYPSTQRPVSCPPYWSCRHPLARRGGAQRLVSEGLGPA